jgi:hypothetical protein
MAIKFLIKRAQVLYLLFLFPQRILAKFAVILRFMFNLVVGLRYVLETTVFATA